MPRSTASVKRPRRKAAGRFHHGDLREAVILAAIAAVERDGAEALTIRSLASRLGVTDPAIYRHFKSRDAVLAEVGFRGAVEFVKSVAGAMEGPTDPILRLAAGSREYVRWAAAHRGWFRLWSSRDFNDRFADVVPPEDYATFGMHLHVAIKECLAAIVGETDKLADHYRMYWGLGHGLAGLVVERVFQLVKTDEERIKAADAAIDLYLDTLRAAHPPTRA